MFAWLGTFLCFFFRRLHELETRLYEGLCIGEEAKHGHRSITKELFFYWIPTFAISLGVIYGMYRLFNIRQKSFRRSSEVNLYKDINLTGKVAIISGANYGIGREISQILLKQGACVIMATQDRNKCEDAKREIIDYLTSKSFQSLQTLEQRIIILSLDLSSLKSIQDFVIKFNQLGLPLHYLINCDTSIPNNTNIQLSKDGIEYHFQYNYLSHYYLTRLLTSNLHETPDSRVINLTSIGYELAPKPFSEWINKHYEMPQAPTKEEHSTFYEYAISKACMILFTREYSKRNKIISVCIPSSTNIDTKICCDNTWLNRFRYSCLNALKLLPNESKLNECTTSIIMNTIINSNDKIRSGGYYNDCNSMSDNLREDMYDDGKDAKLWELSEGLIEKAGYDFNINEVKLNLI